VGEHGIGLLGSRAQTGFRPRRAQRERACRQQRWGGGSLLARQKASELRTRLTRANMLVAQHQLTLSILGGPLTLSSRRQAQCARPSGERRGRRAVVMIYANCPAALRAATASGRAPNGPSSSVSGCLRALGRRRRRGIGRLLGQVGPSARSMSAAAAHSHPLRAKRRSDREKPPLPHSASWPTDAGGRARPPQG